MAVSPEEVAKGIQGLQEGIERIQRSLLTRQERLIVMIDRSNLDLTFRRIDAGGKRLDYVKLVRFVQGNRYLKQTRIYYSEFAPEQVAQADQAAYNSRQEFYNFLKHQGYFLHRLPRRDHNGTKTEKGLDAAIVQHMASLCKENRCDTICLIAGDADYSEVVTHVQSEFAARVEVAFFPMQTARELQFRASKFIDLVQSLQHIVRDAPFSQGAKNGNTEGNNLPGPVVQEVAPDQRETSA